ncbi:MAG: hypothetical protein ACRYFS_08865 [Janthinobacterium lividum]
MNASTELGIGVVIVICSVGIGYLRMIAAFESFQSEQAASASGQSGYLLSVSTGLLALALAVLDKAVEVII